MDPVPSQTAIGFVSKYLQQKYGFSKNCQVVAFTGDNPSALVGKFYNKLNFEKTFQMLNFNVFDCEFVWSFEVGNSMFFNFAGIGSRKEDIICSLGTSDTLFLWQKEPKVLENGHVLINPLDDQSYMIMLW